MTDERDHVVASLVDVLDRLERMNTEIRMQVGEQLAIQCRQPGRLSRFELENRRGWQRCFINAGPLSLRIDASFEKDDLDIPF